MKPLDYKELATVHTSLQRGKVWCRTCLREQKVDSAACLQYGWPKCHGHTMTIDHPETWKVAP